MSDLVVLIKSDTEYYKLRRFKKKNNDVADSTVKQIIIKSK